jgi:hypothetical protein
VEASPQPVKVDPKAMLQKQ